MCMLLIKTCDQDSKIFPVICIRGWKGRKYSENIFSNLNNASSCSQSEGLLKCTLVFLFGVTLLTDVEIDRDFSLFLI